MGKNSKKVQQQKPRQPDLSIHANGFRLELDHLPRFRTFRWVIGLLFGAGLVAVKLFFHVHVGG